MDPATRITFTLMLLFHSSMCSAEEDEEGLFCPEDQRGFDDACYEFVGFQLSSQKAQAWCERGGGHLAFILSDEIQQFFQTHLHPDKDWWIGLAPVAANLTLDFSSTEGSLAWLDGSDVSYDNWANAPDAGATCGHILRHSGFQWEASQNCGQEFNFICQFDTGKTIACENQNATLKCGSGQMIEIEDAFYGRKTVHYCQSKQNSTPSLSQQECSWINVVDSVTAHCHGQQACQVPVDLNLFSEPCAVLGSYLSIEYHCKQGLHLLISKLASISDDVTITVKWLLHPFQGNLTCAVNAGDGYIIDPYIPEEMESTVIHKFQHPGVFTVEVECSTSDWHVSAEKSITIQEPVGGLSVTRCYSRDVATDGTKCNALLSMPVYIQLQVEAGTNVSYTVHHEAHVIANLSVDNGIAPTNATLNASVVQRLGQGCHNLSVTASNRVTSRTASSGLVLCLLEPVEGLQASLITEEELCPDSTDLIISVSLEQGTPVELLFNFSGTADTLTEMRHMFNKSGQMYTFSNPLEGLSKVMIRATNAFSSSDVEVDLVEVLRVCQNHTETLLSQDGQKGSLAECYFKAGRRPPIESQDSHTEYVVPSRYLEASRRMLHNITVIVYGKTVPGFVNYTLPVPGFHPEVTFDPPAVPSCSISPPSGTVLQTFDITCEAKSFCEAGCLYCFKTSTGKDLWCTSANKVKSIFLPSGDETNNDTLTLMVTVKNKYTTINTTVAAQVRKGNSSTTVTVLGYAVEKSVSQLEEQGLLSSEALGQIFTSVSDILNSEWGQEQKDNRSKLRERMLTKMTGVLLKSPSNTTQEVQVMARAVAGLTQSSDELSDVAQVQYITSQSETISGYIQYRPKVQAGFILSASSPQEKATSLLVDLSSSLNVITVNQLGGDDEVLQAATPIIESASNVLNVSLSSRKVSDSLLTGIKNIQSALLNNRKMNGQPAIIDSGQISVYVNRISPDSIQMQNINGVRNSSSRFSFPSLPADILSVEDPVDVRMISFEKNPYSWMEENITGTVGSLSLTRANGTVIPVENLPEEIEIFLPRTDMGQENSTVLDLAYFSTLMIDVPSPDVTLVLKLQPSEDLSFILLLGYKGYPNYTNYVAKTQFPLENINEEEKFTWVLRPKDRTRDVGVHYLVIKPIVEPGVKSINATVTVISVAAQCKYWNESTSSWSEDGCRVGPLTTPLVTQCLCNHLTFFGSSFFVMPNLVDVSRTAELFATFANNPVVVCFVATIFAAYVLVVLWARRKDIQDSAKVKITDLGDNDPLAEYRYMLTISTGHRRGASTSSQVTITLQGTEGESEPHHLTDPEKPVFERGGMDMFLLTTHFSLGELQSIRLWHDNSGDHPAWYVNNVMVQDLELGHKWHFLCNSWLAVDVAECTLDKVFPVATETDMKRFSNLFFMKTAKDFRDGHIWFSVISRPPCSTFTRVQRVSCCFSLLLCTMLTSIMFWGIPTDPSEQTMDLGHIEFTWQQVIIGIQSSIIMFPINLLIVSIFRNSRPREKVTKTDVSKQGNTVRVSPSETSSSQMEMKNITPDTVIKDIKRMAKSLSKAMKNPFPHLELGPDQHADINTLLTVLENIIRQQNEATESFYSDTSKTDNAMILTLGSVNLQENSVWSSPVKTPKDFQKISNNSKYLYRQLHHVEKELGLLGPSRFPNPNNYNRAMQQVQGLKSHLESSLDGDKPSPEGSINGSTKKKQIQRGLPWWFVFVGWILVIATSGVSGYFTMMYGLTYGKDRSISWLISMVVSFFESLFITQPLKVLGFAAFFALVLKQVDLDEFGEPQIEENFKRTDDPEVVPADRRDSTCSFYQPPPPTDIEKMRNSMIKEQKVFSLIKEILGYMGFMWVLLLVAYGQRDPNAYFLTRHIRQSFSKGISDTMSIQDVFTWANTTLLNNLFGEYPGFITDGNSKLVGNARLRQVRMQKGSCLVALPMQISVPDCHALYSWELEDTGSYSPGWSPLSGNNATLNPHNPWIYKSQHKLRAYPICGNVKLYRGGGFATDLLPDLKNSSRVLQYLYDNIWLDVYTQALFVEFTVYNANVNLFCIVTLILETTATGAFQFRSELQSVRLYQSTGGLHIFVMASEVVYFLFIIYYMFVQGKLMKRQRLAYFQSKWNLLELAIIFLSWSALSVFIKRTLLGQRDVSQYENNKDQFVSFHETAQADAVLGYLIAFLVLLATVKLWHLLRLNPKLHMITATLQRAWTDISGFLVVIAIMFLAYSVASNLMYGWKLYSYRTLLEAAQTIVSLQLGIFNYEEVLNYNPLLGAFLIGSCIVFMTFVILNLFISVILVAFTQEQIHHKPSEEEEIVDLMLMKLCSLFGLKSKKKDDALTEEAPISSALETKQLTISTTDVHDGWSVSLVK
ncbi:polycystic kidney disease protein 1-like 2 [Oryzias latipes]|uniref:polycystic kidney disease protein 1-like 2 n=1 Tax=Oryzias latipes TaxID=8090 RepID=UPI000CE20E51|nr:polycystic kidney disease protein 1-like 2 [Oryzias latipes]